VNSPSGGSRINQVNVRELGDLVSTLTGRQRTLATTAVANNNFGAPDPNSSAVVLPRLAGRRATPVDTKGVRSLSLGDKATRCTNCGNKSTVGKKFCATCGSALPRRCSKCESKNAPTSAFCEDCGAAQAGNAALGGRRIPERIDWASALVAHHFLRALQTAR
jgi:predicted RNA-binding Zn-ribbon protein involved in translation (DUF1610 family)